MKATSPWIRWLRLSLVEICTVRRSVFQAASISVVSGTARMKFPPSATNAFTDPSRMPSQASTVLRPFSIGGSKS